MKNLTNQGILCLLFVVSGALYSQTPTPVPCSSGTLFNADLTDYITVPNTPFINEQNTKNRTIEFWFKTDDITSKQVMYEEGGNVNAIAIYLEDGRIYLGAYRRQQDGTPGERRFFRSGTTIQAATWYHVAFSIEGPAGAANTDNMTYQWYLNGAEQDPQTGPVVDTHTGEISLARNGSSLMFPPTNSGWTASGGSGSETSTSVLTEDDDPSNFTGNIALFRIWNVARDSTQINDNKSTLLTPLTSGSSLVAYLDQETVYYQASGQTAPTSEVSLNLKIAYFTIPNTDAINLQDTNNRTIEFRFKADDMTTKQVLYEEGGNVNAFTIYIEDGRLYLGAYRSEADTPANRRFF
jgi:hypothetical protein